MYALRERTDFRDDKDGSADEWNIELIKESMEGNFLPYSPLLMRKNIRESLLTFF